MPGECLGSSEPWGVVEPRNTIRVAGYEPPVKPVKVLGLSWLNRFIQLIELVDSAY